MGWLSANIFPPFWQDVSVQSWQSTLRLVILAKAILRPSKCVTVVQNKLITHRVGRPLESSEPMPILCEISGNPLRGMWQRCVLANKPVYESDRFASKLISQHSTFQILDETTLHQILIKYVRNFNEQLLKTE